MMMVIAALDPSCEAGAFLIWRSSKEMMGIASLDPSYGVRDGISCA
jgi:hypothetical protein